MKTTTAILLAGVAIGLGTAAASLVPWYYEQQEKEAIITAEKERQKKSREESDARKNKAKWVEKAVYLKHIVYQKFLKRRANSPYVRLIDHAKTGRFYCLAAYPNSGLLPIKRATNKIKDEFADTLITAWKKDKLVKEHNISTYYDSLTQGDYDFPKELNGYFNGCDIARDTLFRKNRQFSK